MKEIGMGKLIELLNEYLFELGRKTIIESYRKDSLEDVCGTFRGIVEGKKDYPYTSIWGIEVISKKFGFIKWLVENDIDFRKADADISKDIVLGMEPDFADFMVFRRFADDEKVIMLLSISDTPIEDLISYLK